MKEEGEYFNDSDFEEEDKKKKKQKKVTYKDVVRREALKKIDGADGSESGSESDAGNRNDLFSKSKQETLAEEQQRLKDEFKQAALKDSDDDILIKKDANEDESSDDVEMKPARKSNLNLQTDEDVLKQLYGGKSGEKMDQTDAFLRNYVLGEGWKDKQKADEDHYKTYQDENVKIDNEDEDRDLEMDCYEQKYNFRFEEKNSAYLTTHGREAPADSMRRIDDRRKEQRKDAKTRKEEEKLKKKEEINKLKAWKREEIIEKLKKTEFIAGNFGTSKV